MCNSDIITYIANLLTANHNEYMKATTVDITAYAMYYVGSGRHNNKSAFP